MAREKRRGHAIATLVVRVSPRLPGAAGPRGHLLAGQTSLACALGRGGVTRRKREGDGATPAGTMRALRGFFRLDKMPRPFCRLPLRASTRDLGWCDAPGSPLYNRSVRLPATAGHEKMWRHDGLYDVVLVLDWNIGPRRAGRGSAIFLHCAKQGLRPTLGCVALAPDDLRRLLPRLSSKSRLRVL